MSASAKLHHNCCLSACLGVGTHLADQKFMALRLMKSLPTMVVLLVAMVAIIVTEPHLAVAAPGFLGRDGYGPGRNGGNNEEHRNRSSSSTGNGGIHNGGVSSGAGNGGSKHVGGNMHVGRINKGRINNGGHNRSNINIHPGNRPGLGNPSGHKGGKGGRTINIRRKRDRSYRSTHSGNNKEDGHGGHIPVRGNIHAGNNGTNGHEGRNIHPGLVNHRGSKGPGKGGQTYIGVRNGGRYRSNRAGNRKGNGGHISVGRNGGSNRGINHGGLNKTRGNGGRKTHMGGNGGTSGGNHTGDKAPGGDQGGRNVGNSGDNIGKAPGAGNGGDKGGSNVGNPGDNNEGNHSDNNSGHVGQGGNGAGNATGPDCKKKGGICGDPKVVGGDGVVFYFHGRKNHDFCLVSDSDLHINAHFIGTRPPGRTRDNTWVQALGFVFGPHTLTIAAKRNISQWHNQVDHLDFSYNGEPLNLTTMSWKSPDAAMTLTRIGAANSVDMTIKGKMEVSLTVIPISKKANQVHKYAILEDVDCFAHFDMQFRFYNLSSSVDGVLGQTYRPGFINPVDRSVALPIMGGVDKFKSSSLLATDCKSSQYTASASPVGSGTANFHTVCGSSGLPAGVPGGITCHR